MSVDSQRIMLPKNLLNGSFPVVIKEDPTHSVRNPFCTRNELNEGNEASTRA